MTDDQFTDKFTLLADQWALSRGIVSSDGTQVGGILYSAPEDKGVRNVGLIGGTTGLIVDGSPIISSGVMTLRGVLNVKNGGTGVSSLEDLKLAMGLAKLTNLSVQPDDSLLSKEDRDKLNMLWEKSGLSLD